MHSHFIEDFRHAHVFLRASHVRNERKTWTVIAICTAMMLAGLWFGSVALVADGLHMSTHAGALLIAALAYTYSRQYALDHRFAFGIGKLGDLAAFTSALALAMIALLIGYESLSRFFAPLPIAFDQAIPIAVLGLGVNLLVHFYYTKITTVTHIPRTLVRDRHAPDDFVDLTSIFEKWTEMTNYGLARREAPESPRTEGSIRNVSHCLDTVHGPRMKAQSAVGHASRSQ